MAQAQVTPFSFEPQLNAPLGTQVVSNSVQVKSTEASSPISIVGGEYSIGGNAFTSQPGTVLTCQTVRVRVLSSASPGTTTSATLNIGGITGTFAVTTAAADPVPDAFGFTAQTGVNLSAQIRSNAITVTGTNTASPISISGGQYSVNGGAFTEAAGTAPPGSTVTVQLTSAATSATTTQAVLNIGGVSGAFTVTTRIVTSSLSVSPGLINFVEPELAISAVSSPRNVTVTNSTNTSIAISAVSVVGPAGSNFRQTNNCVGTIGPGASCSIAVTFNRSTAGVRVGEIVISTDLSVGPPPITLVGNRNASGFVDFDGNGRDDSLWRHAASGDNVIWLMNGAGRVTNGANGGPIEAVPDGNWSVAGAADFNGDGKTDILWRNNATGANSIFLMDGTTRIGGGATTARTNTSWQIVATGDFDADGKADILWRNSSTGANGIWIMNGVTRVRSASLTTVADRNWRIAGTGDFNADGKSDIVWRHSITGDNSIWLMDGTTRAGGGAITQVVDANWQIAGVGDFNGDGKADILWRHEVLGLNSVWLMDGTTRIGGGPTLTVPDLGWRVERISDFNADGKSDILWRHSGVGDNSIWIMDGVTRAGGGPVDAVSDTLWTIVP